MKVNIIFIYYNLGDNVWDHDKFKKLEEKRKRKKERHERHKKKA